MHERVFAEFESVCRARGAGGAVLEIGAVPGPEALLCLPALAGATEKVGVALDGPSRHADFEILRANANDLSCFEDARFDTVLTNSVLEHDPRFWLTLAEIRRVARPGALVAIGVPGYGPRRLTRGARLVGAMASVPLLGRPLRAWADALSASTPTLVVHRFPGDYYRFGEQAVRDVLLAGLEEVEVRTVLVPPRYVGAGRRPGPEVPDARPDGIANRSRRSGRSHGPSSQPSA